MQSRRGLALLTALVLSGCGGTDTNADAGSDPEIDAGPDCTGFSVLLPVELPVLPRDVPAELTFTASGNATFTLTTGALPAGMMLAEDGRLFGSPTAAGSYPLVVSARSETGCTRTFEYTVVVECSSLSITSPVLSPIEAGAPIAEVFTQSGAVTPTFSMASGALPPGVTLTPEGELTGAAALQGSFAFAAKVEDADGCSAVGDELSLVVTCPAAEVVVDKGGDGGVLPRYRDVLFLVGNPVAPVRFGLDGGYGLPAAWSVSGGSLAPGVSIEDGGLLGAPTAMAADSSFTVRAEFAGGCSAEKTLSTLNCAITAPPNTWTKENYFVGSTPWADGAINGLNMFLDKEKAARFDVADAGVDLLVGAVIEFGRARASAPGKQVPIRVYDGTSAWPGAALGWPDSQSLSLDRIVQDVSQGERTWVNFGRGIDLPASRRFFISVDLTQLTWQSNEAADSLAVVSNKNGQTVPAATWERQSNNSWYQYNTAGSWALNTSLYVMPQLCR